MNLDRRHFLVAALGLPAFGWVLQGCGGGHSSALLPGVGILPGALGLTRVPVTITHGSDSAAGTLPAYAQMSVATSFGAVSADAGGRASVLALSGDSSLAFASDTAGNVVYLGWVSSTRTALNAGTTAEVLLYYVLGAYLMPAEIQEKVCDIIAGSDSVRNRLTGIVSSFLETHPAHLNGDTTALVAAVLSEAQSLLSQIPDYTATTGRNTRAVKIDNPGERSGLELTQAAEPNTVLVQNTRLRRAVLVVNRLDAQGNPTQVALSDIAVPRAFDGFANTVSGWVEAVYGNQTFADGSTNAGFFSSASDKVGLPLFPADAEKTKYRVVVLQAGSVPGNEAIFGALLPTQQEYLRGFNLKNIQIRALLEDMLAPFLFGFVSKRVAGDKALIEAFAGDLFKTLQEVVPGLMEQVAAGRKTPWDAFGEIAKSITLNPSTGVTSPAFQKLIGITAQAIVSKYTDIAGSIGAEIFVKNVSEGLIINGIAIPGVGRVLAILEGVDKVLAYGSRTRQITDALISSELEYWDVTTTPSKVTLTPNKASVAAAGIAAFTAKVIDADLNASLITYHWTLTGKGTLTNPANGSEGTTLDTFGASVSYRAANTVTNGEITVVSVEAFVGGVNNPGRFSVGKTTAQVTIRQSSASVSIVTGSILIRDDVPGEVRVFLVAPVVDPADRYHYEVPDLNDPSFFFGFGRPYQGDITITQQVKDSAVGGEYRFQNLVATGLTADDQAKTAKEQHDIWDGAHLTWTITKF